MVWECRTPVNELEVQEKMQGQAHKNFAIRMMPVMSAFCAFAVSLGIAQQDQEPAFELTEQTAKEHISVYLQVEPLMKDNPVGSSVRCTISISNNAAEPITVYHSVNYTPVSVLILDARAQPVPIGVLETREKPHIRGVIPEISALTIPPKGFIKREIIYFDKRDDDKKPIILPKGQYTAQAFFVFLRKERSAGIPIALGSDEVRFTVE